MNEKLNSYPVFEQWYRTTNWILTAVDRMPKNTRFTVSARISQITIENIELFVKAIYNASKVEFLTQININLETLRIFFRLAADRNYISKEQYKYIIGDINQTGKQVGGWLKKCKE